MMKDRISVGVSRSRHWLTVGTALLIGLGIGGWFGVRAGSSPLIGLAARLPELAEKGRQERAGDVEPAPSDPGFDSWMMALALAAKADSLEGVIDELKSRDLEPRDLVRGAITEMDEREISSAISMVTAFDSDDLAEVQDMRAFATRLADIAMAGTLTEADEPSEDSSEIFFAERAPRRGEGAESHSVFPTDSRRIYAVFRTDQISDDVVMLKWFRTDRPKILLFRRYTINPRDDYGWVWLDKQGDWSEGTYQVDLFLGDEEMPHLAVGRFEVRGE
jgi:hypothetical protein